jgi:hypothetical protein
MRHWLLALALAAAGCGAPKTVVSGRVTLDGQPLDNGTIEFFPVRGDSPTAAAVIDTAGRYRTAAAPTQMKVVIHSSKVVGRRKMYDDVPDSPTVDLLAERLPGRYSDMTKTELTVTLTPGDNVADFPLTGGPKKK